MDHLTDKVFVLTGAGSGLGQASAVMAARRGARVVLADLNEAGLAETAGQLSDLKGNVRTLVTDVRRTEDNAALAQTALDAFGRLDGAVCAAGVDWPRPLLEMSLQDWDSLIAINLTGTFLTLQAAARVMAANNYRGSLVTLSSGIAFRGRPNGAHYAASKGGVISLTKSFALELAALGIRVNSVAPSATDTPMLHRQLDGADIEASIRTIPMGRLGQPDDIARVVCFLLSDESGWVTGQTIPANGGRIMP